MWRLALLLTACGRVAFDPLVDGGQAPDDVMTGGEPNARACLTNSAYQAKAGLANRYREGVPTVSWNVAVATCAAEDAHLWIVDSVAEQNAWTGDWTGVTDAGLENTWLTILGVPATFLPWASGEPAGDATENCVRTDSAGFEERDCNDLRDFVCECPTN